MPYIVRPAFLERLHDLEEKYNRRYSWAEVGRKMNLSRQSAQSLFTGESTDAGFTKYGTLAKLLDFFESEKMPVKIGDLFDVDTVTTTDEGSDNG